MLIEKVKENKLSYDFLFESDVQLNDKYLDTIMLLTKNNENNIQEFKEIFKKENEFIALAISKYRDKVRQQGRGYVSYIEINEAYNKGDIEKLRQLFSELLLEYIYNWEIEEMMKLIRKGKTSINRIYENFMKVLEEEGYCRFLYLIKFYE